MMQPVSPLRLGWEKATISQGAPGTTTCKYECKRIELSVDRHSTSRRIRPAHAQMTRGCHSKCRVQLSSFVHMPALRFGVVTKPRHRPSRPGRMGVDGSSVRIRKWSNWPNSSSTRTRHRHDRTVTLIGVVSQGAKRGLTQL
jgi:hypothetical protein